MTETAALRNPFEGTPERIWVLVLLRGVLAATIGFYALVNPVATLLALIWVLGIYWIIDGSFLLITGFTGTAGKSKWWLILLRALLSIIAGILIVANPILGLFTSVFLVYIVGIQAIIGGGLELLAAMKSKQHLDNGWVLILHGALAVIFGVMLLMAPLFSAVVLTQIIGAFALVLGVSAIFFAFRLHGSAKKA
jgi:uncharacterized membrane protein HdeD (DUF308 family)